jgi:uncharacterized membrane protein YebE (DUF533 family)
MSHTDSALLVLAKLALADGKIDCSEEGFLADMITDSETYTDIQKLLEEASNKSLAEMVNRLEKYEDKFFVAMRAYLMAHVDLHLDLREEAMLNELVTLLEISDADQQLIKETEKNLKKDDPAQPSERIQLLYQASSFFQAENAD